MGLLNTIRNWNQQRFNKKLDKWYIQKKKDGDMMEYNPLLSHINFGENQLQEYVDRMNENYAWSKGDPATLFKLYSKYREDSDISSRRSRTNKGINRLVESNWWYAKLFIDNEEGVENAVRYSTGVSAKIPSTIATLCMGNGYTYNLEQNEQELDENHELFEDLEYLMDENNFYITIFKSFRLQSTMGGFVYKWSMIPEFDTPVLEVVNPMKYRYESRAGRITKDVFLKYYYREEKTYKLEEHYGVDNEGAYIRFKLYAISTVNSEGAEWEEVQISELEETRDLVDVHIKGYFNRLSLYVPNKSVNSQFPDSLYGESDYTGSYGALNFLDESYSTYAQELRDGRLLKYIPENMVEFDEAGNAEYTSFLRSTHLVTKNGIGQDADDKIEYRQADVDTDKSREAIKQNYMIVLNNAGLSPLTFGLTGLESIDASAQSQQEREKVSIRTRNTKNEIQEKAISFILGVGLDLYQLFKNLQVQENTDIYVANIEPVKVIFKFNDYILKSKADRVEEVRSGLESGVYDLRTAIEYVHEDLTDEEKLSIKINSKIEKGIPLTPLEATYFNLGEPEEDTNIQLEEEDINPEELPENQQDINIEETIEEV